MSIKEQRAAKSRLGLLLIRKGLITPEQLDLALKEQSRSGLRLGEVLVSWGMVTERQINRALKRQSRYRLIAAVAAVLLGPIQPFMSFAWGSTTADKIEQLEGDYASLRALGDDEMAGVTGQADNRLMANFDNMVQELKGEKSDDNGLGPLDDLAALAMPFSSVLDADVTVSGVHYDASKPKQTLNADGSITVALPSQIEEISFKNVRVMGSSGPAFGDLIVSNIQFSPESSMTIRIRE